MRIPAFSADMEKVLIIEDDADINGMIKEALSQEGYECVSAYSGTEGLLRIGQEKYSIILLDLMLPGISGEELLREAEKITNTPFIVISAKDELDTKVDMLTLGADDYITKPFDLKELKARIIAALRRSSRAETPDILKYKELTLDTDSHEISLEGHVMQFTLQEYKILELMLRNPNKVFSKQEIYSCAWDDYYIGEDKTINVHISNIRQKIKKITDEEYIETIWGIGFRLAK